MCDGGTRGVFETEKKYCRFIRAAFIIHFLSDSAVFYRHHGSSAGQHVQDSAGAAKVPVSTTQSLHHCRSLHYSRAAAVLPADR